MDVNATDLNIYAHPSLDEYYSNLNPFIIISMFIASIITILNISIFCTTVAKLRKLLENRFIALSIALCALYPIISLAALLTIMLPKLWLIYHTVMHLSFTVGAVLFHRLCIHYIDSEVNYLKESDGAAVSIVTPPCCCCCLCLPTITPSKLKFCILRYMVWQMPLIQGSVMLILNAIYYKEMELYKQVAIYFLPFIVTSIVIGLWGLNITVRIVHGVHAEYGLMKKMFCLQLILLLCKLQYVVLNSQLDIVTLGGPYPLNHTVYKQTIINLLILVEMILVSILAQNAYKIPAHTTGT